MKKRTPRTTPPGPQAKVLAALAERKVCLTLDELAATLDVPRNRITWGVSRLVTTKYVRRADRGCYEATALGRKAHNEGYHLGPQRPHTGQRPPLQNTLRSRVWTTMRLRKRFTVPDLMENACQGHEKNPYNNILAFLSRLARAGYVRELAGRAPGTAPESNGHKQWLLLNDTGPLPPIIREASIFDPNRGEEISVREVRI